MPKDRSYEESLNALPPEAQQEHMNLMALMRARVEQGPEAAEELYLKMFPEESEEDPRQLRLF